MSYPKWVALAMGATMLTGTAWMLLDAAPDSQSVDPAIQHHQMVHIDPATGTFSEIAGGEATPAPLNNSHEGLTVEQSPVPDGGEVVNLRGRFQNRSTATIVDGRVVTTCDVPADVSELPGAEGGRE